MARAMEAVFAREGKAKHQAKLDIIRDLMADVDRIPLADDKGRMATARDIAVAAEKCVRAVSELCYQLMTTDAILAAVDELCARRGIAPPAGDTDDERIKRAADEAWWRRHLRTEWKRRLEHTSIQLGLTYRTTDPYVSREVAAVQAAQNQANADLLARQIATNELGQQFTLAELAAKGVGNKVNRRNELMTRIRGFEECASALRHVGLFWTITCPSKFHSVGGTNPKYNGATPREAQAYLVDVYARIRAALHRAGIRPYGFRIAEPHTDGCPHWHMLLFVDPARVNDMEMIVTAYAIKEDEEERGAHENRVKLVRMEADKGTAAGYIVKYVCKNIDGTGVGDHKVFENGTTYTIVPDLFGNVELTPSARVTYWSQAWGIRQFQQIGGAPVGVWRELRRVKGEALLNAPEAVRAAHAAAQKIESTDPNVAKQADWADYLWAQGGPAVMRKALAVRVAARDVEINGRYKVGMQKKPVGVYAAAYPLEVYEGVHYRWTISDGRTSAARISRPRTGVNNCTGSPAWTRPECGSPTPGAGHSGGPVHHERTHNAGFNRPGDKGWSKAADRDTVERFKRHSPRHVGSHLQHLQRKYADE
ncbi:replication endonuclease [Massilia sp. TW-1]|uniref:Replication endonuclease n=1 Tax=Telluria antibiotica TaxID=2717319 RepID=A0ABX0PG01_9BURK|nr:replication endonuclease [Telluria antibiotica]NIA56191.1 replication endonuclease [Telluria antibiotica]